MENTKSNKSENLIKSFGILYVVIIVLLSLIACSTISLKHIKILIEIFPIITLLLFIIFFKGTMDIIKLLKKEIKEKDKLINKNEQLYKALFDHNPEMIFSIEPLGNLIDLNPAAKSVTGYEKEELINKPLMSLVTKDKLDSAILHFNRAFEGELNNFQLSFVGKVGNRIEMKVTAIPVITDSSVTEVRGIAQDITYQSLSEKMLLEYAKKLQQSNKDLQQFAYVASHDLQEPLRMITNYLQLLERRYKSKLDSDADEFIGYAVDGAKRMQKLISNLLDYSRINTRENDFKKVDVKDIIKKVIKNLEIVIKDRNAVITYDSLPDSVWADEAALIQLFQNLINNGIKFNDKEQPRIHIICLKDGDNWTFSVADNGIGIPSKYHERIFTIFQRLHTRQEYEGTGIGLAICKRIVERHNGNIKLKSEEGIGTTFYFSIPTTWEETNEQ